MVSLKILTLFVLTFHCMIAYGQQSTSRLNFFDIDLLRYCSEERRGNIMVSPASIKATLAMLLEGARGVTEIEIKSALRVSPKKEDFREQINLFLEGLKINTTGVILQNANSVFVSDVLKMKKEYEKMMKYIYMADVLKMNFTDIDKSVHTINDWVYKKTNGLIPQIVEAVTVNPSTEMLVANAMYFKGNWQRPFNPQETDSACFHAHGTCTKVQMMSLRAEMKYVYLEELRAHAVELPYEGGRHSMILLVPLDRDGCAPLIRDLPYMSLDRIIAIMEPYDVQLTMPKFTINYAENMVVPLQNMRIRTLFSSSSNLTGIFEGVSPYVNSIFHKVHMSVDEQGTVAAAATAAMVIPLIENGIQLRVDRPFVFFIRDNSLGVVLFEGRIEEPTPYVKPIKAHAAPSPAQLITEPQSIMKPAQIPATMTKPVVETPIELVESAPPPKPEPSIPLPYLIQPVEPSLSAISKSPKRAHVEYSSPSLLPAPVVSIESDSSSKPEPSISLPYLIQPVEPSLSDVSISTTLLPQTTVSPAHSAKAYMESSSSTLPSVTTIKSVVKTPAVSVESAAPVEPEPSAPLPYLTQPIEQSISEISGSTSLLSQTTVSPKQSAKTPEESSSTSILPSSSPEPLAETTIKPVVKTPAESVESAALLKPEPSIPFSHLAQPVEQSLSAISKSPKRAHVEYSSPSLLPAPVVSIESYSPSKPEPSIPLPYLIQPVEPSLSDVSILTTLLPQTTVSPAHSAKAYMESSSSTLPSATTIQSVVKTPAVSVESAAPVKPEPSAPLPYLTQPIEQSISEISDSTSLLSQTTVSPKQSAKTPEESSSTSILPSSSPEPLAETTIKSVVKTPAQSVESAALLKPEPSIPFSHLAQPVEQSLSEILIYSTLLPQTTTESPKETAEADVEYSTNHKLTSAPPSETLTEPVVKSPAMSIKPAEFDKPEPSVQLAYLTQPVEQSISEITTEPTKQLAKTHDESSSHSMLLASQTPAPLAETTIEPIVKTPALSVTAPSAKPEQSVPFSHLTQPVDPSLSEISILTTLLPQTTVSPNQSAKVNMEYPSPSIFLEPPSETFKSVVKTPAVSVESAAPFKPEPSVPFSHFADLYQRYQFLQHYFQRQLYQQNNEGRHTYKPPHAQYHQHYQPQNNLNNY